jgi:hypothetical protein
LISCLPHRSGLVKLNNRNRQEIGFSLPCCLRVTSNRGSQLGAAFAAMRQNIRQILSFRLFKGGNVSLRQPKRKRIIMMIGAMRQQNSSRCDLKTKRPFHSIAVEADNSEHGNTIPLHLSFSLARILQSQAHSTLWLAAYSLVNLVQHHATPTATPHTKFISASTNH